MSTIINFLGCAADYNSPILMYFLKEERKFFDCCRRTPSLLNLHKQKFYEVTKGEM